MNQLIKSVEMPGKYIITMEEAEFFGPGQPLNGYNIIIDTGYGEVTQTAFFDLNLALVVFQAKLELLEGN